MLHKKETTGTDASGLIGGQKMANEKRLIDANALMDSFRSHMVENYDRNKCTKEENCTTCEPGCLWRKKVSAAPTVNAVEAVHGRWIGDGWGSYIKRCSVCRSVPLREVGGRHDACYSNYCPNCGAKMDGDGNG